MTAEAKIAAGPGILVIPGGGDGPALERALRAVAGTSRAILSFGIAGGLDPVLRPGSCRVASGVTAPDGARYRPDERWSQTLSRLLDVPRALMAGVDVPLAGTAEKRALFEAAGAALVDMESHIAARVAADHGCPFAAVRVVADSADHALPHAATVGMGADGEVDVAAVLRSLARDPRQIPALIRTARDARAAFAGLFRSRQLMGGRLGLVDGGDPRLDVA